MGFYFEGIWSDNRKLYSLDVFCCLLCERGLFNVLVRPQDEEKKSYVTLETGKMWLAAEAWSVGCHADFGLSQMQTADHKTTRLHREPKISHKHLTTEAERRRENFMFWGRWRRATGRSSGPHSCTRSSKLPGTEDSCCVFKIRILDFRCNRLAQSSVHIWDPQCHITYQICHMQINIPVC